MEDVHSIRVGKDSLSLLPRKSGCYIFKQLANEEGVEKVIYVGKAKSLRDRVKNYFTTEGDGRALVQFIKLNTAHIEYIVTPTEQDALVLENELIKRLKPKYNIHLKDDKTYLSLRLDLKHEWPRVEITRKIRKDSAIYLGPFSSSTRLRETINFMQKIFPLRTCPDSKLYNRSRPCIEYDIKRCVAPCVGYVSKDEYDHLVDAAILFLKGETEDLIFRLKNEMEKAVEVEAYEKAAKIRDQIQSIEYVTEEKSSVVGSEQRRRGVSLDAIGLARSEGLAILSIVFIRGGVVWDQRSFELNVQEEIDSPELLRQFLERYYSSGVYLPPEILISEPVGADLFEARAQFIIPRNEEKKRFLEMAENNARVKLEVRIQKSEKISKVLDDLHRKLQLSKRPSQMDCFDISHFQGSQTVASVVRFKEGLPDKSFYRKIKLTEDQVDDFQSLHEAVTRRYKSAEELPDLIVVDGGKGQLNSVLDALKKQSFEGLCDVISLAKARESDSPIDPLNPMNRERVFKPGRMNPILLKETSSEELLLSYLRDEAHRFAIEFHRLRKKKELSTSVLDEISGVSSRLKLKLLKAFGSIDGIEKASDAELLKIIKPSVLERIREKLNRQDIE